MFVLGFLFGIIIGFIVESADWEEMWNTAPQDRQAKSLSATPAQQWHDFLNRLDDDSIFGWGVAFAFVFWICGAIATDKRQ